MLNNIDVNRAALCAFCHDLDHHCRNNELCCTSRHCGTVCCMMVVTVSVWLQDRKGVQFYLAGPEPVACRPFCVVPPAARCVAGNGINDR